MTDSNPEQFGPDDDPTSPSWHFQRLSADTFTVTDMHLALLRRMSIQWAGPNLYGAGEPSAPAVNPVQPYGSSDVFGDIAMITGKVDEWVDWDHGDYTWTRHGEIAAARLHAEAGLALQVCLEAGEFRSGLYTRDDGPDWLPRWRRTEMAAEPSPEAGPDPGTRGPGAEHAPDETAAGGPASRAVRAFPATPAQRNDRPAAQHPGPPPGRPHHSHAPDNHPGRQSGQEESPR